jgi:hypothetical protein
MKSDLLWISGSRVSGYREGGGLPPWLWVIHLNARFLCSSFQCKLLFCIYFTDIGTHTAFFTSVGKGIVDSALGGAAQHMGCDKSPNPICGWERFATAKVPLYIRFYLTNRSNGFISDNQVEKSGKWWYKNPANPKPPRRMTFVPRAIRTHDR